GADASSAGMVDAGFENQKELTKMQLDNQKEIAEMQNETQKEIAGIQSATSRQNTKDQVYAQNEMLAYQQKESTARVASIMSESVKNDKPTISMSLSHCIHQTLNSKASTRFHSGGLQQSCTLILNTFLFGVIILIANILKRSFSSELPAKLRNRLLVL